MNKPKITGFVVTYNPSIKQIKNLKNTSKLVDILYVYDNSCNHLTKKNLKSILDCSNIKISFNKKNYGIGKSANIFFKKIRRKSDWCILLDQDSNINFDLKIIAKYLENKKILIAGFNFNKKTSSEKFKNSIELKPVSRIIFSGSLVNKKIFNKFFFDEELFLDMIDFAFCKILNLNNIKIWKITNVYFEHHIGATKINSFLLFKKKRTNHPPLRCFLMARNRILLFKQKLYDQSLFNILLRQFKEIVYTFLFEVNKKDKIFARFKGIWHGLIGTRFDSIDDIKKIL